MKITAKGQVTIPKELREKFGLRPGTEVDFIPEEDGIKIVRKLPRGIGRMVVERMRGKGTVKLTTDEIMALTRGDD